MESKHIFSYFYKFVCWSKKNISDSINTENYTTIYKEIDQVKQRINTLELMLIEMKLQNQLNIKSKKIIQLKSR